MILAMIIYCHVDFEFLMISFLCQVFFVESICDDPDVIATNILVNDAFMPFKPNYKHT